MRKWMTGFLTVTLCLALAAPALAQSAPPAGRGSDPGFTDEQKATIQAKIDEIKALKAELAEAHQASRAQAEINKGLLEDLKEEYGGGLIQELREKRAELRAFREENVQPTMEEVRALQQELKAAREAGDRETAAEIRAELEALRSEYQPLMEEFQGLRAELQALMEQAGPLREKMQELREQLQPLRQEQQDLLAELREIRAAGREARQELRSAFESGNFGQVISTLEEIIQLEKQALKVAGDFLDLQKQVTALLEAI